MIIIQSIPFRRRAKRANSSTPQPAALTLVSAAFDYPDLSAVTLTFDRAIDISAIDITAIQVSDGEFTLDLYQGFGGASLLSPTSVRVMLTAIGDPTDVDVTLTATGATGIVAVDDGAVWAGVTDLELPFP